MQGGRAYPGNQHVAGYNEFAAAPRPWSHTTKRVAGGGDAAVAGVARRSSLGREAGGRGDEAEKKFFCRIV